jgi:hypothetical protein
MIYTFKLKFLYSDLFVKLNPSTHVYDLSGFDPLIIDGTNSFDPDDF